MRSMTGFGRSTVSSADGGRSIDCELRSVNQRGIDIKTRLPRELSGFESRIVGQLKQRFDRGRIDVVMISRLSNAPAKRIVLDEGAASELVQALRGLGERIGLSTDLRVGDLLQRPELFSVEDVAASEDDLWRSIEDVLSRASDDLLESREREGAALWQELAARVQRCRELVKEIGQRTAGAPNRIQQRLTQRLAELEGAGVDAARIAQEVAMLAERADVGEEIDRLEIHLDHFCTLAGQSGAVGRKLDFLCQELNREANTVGSKCSDAPTAHHVVELKAEIERVREQVQNIE